MAEEKKKQAIKETDEILVRILGHDIFGSKNIYAGLTKIKGVSWCISNIVCNELKLDRSMRISDLDKSKIKEIENALENLKIPSYLKNRQKDFDSGEDNHLYGVNLDMRRDFDIKRMQKIRSYKGVRHSFKLPVRGQRTRSHFRKSGIAVGVKRPKTGKKS